jgi:hypothetical protein
MSSHSPICLFFFKEAACVRMRARTLSSFGNSWTCACGLTVEDTDDALALGHNQLSGIVKSCLDDTVDALWESLHRPGPPSSTEGQYSRLASRTSNSPPARCDNHCVLLPGTSCVLADTSSCTSRPRGVIPPPSCLRP